MEHSLTAELAGFPNRPRELLEGIERLAKLLERFQPAREDAVPLPPRVRPLIGQVAALLALATSKAELHALASQFKVDLRDLNETEVTYLEKVSAKTVRDWRTNGTGPAYRNEAGIRYPVLWLWEWRQKGRQTLTSQKAARGRRKE